jgi:aspartyl-tRNA(Asn)/glutamyl-tRNA(Gln) amidotransferase subunit A
MPAIRCTKNVIAKQIERKSPFIRHYASQQHTSSNAFIHVVDTPPSTPSNSRKILNRRRIAIKDNIYTAGIPTTCASGILKDFQSPFDATVVEKLKEHGAVVYGKTNMDEFGMGSHSTHSYFGPVKSKDSDGNYTMSAGGSSGGSAVAVAEGPCKG